MYRVIITVGSENAANILKSEIEQKIPLVEGNVVVFKEPEITTLDKIITAQKRKPLSRSDLTQ